MGNCCSKAVPQPDEGDGENDQALEVVQSGNGLADVQDQNDAEGGEPVPPKQSNETSAVVHNADPNGYVQDGDENDQVNVMVQAGNHSDGMKDECKDRKPHFENQSKNNRVDFLNVHQNEDENVKPAAAAQEVENSDNVPAQNTGDNVPAQNTGDNVPAQNTGDNVPAQNDSDNVPAQNDHNNVPAQNASNNVPAQNASDNVPAHNDSDNDDSSAEAGDTDDPGQDQNNQHENLPTQSKNRHNAGLQARWSLGQWDTRRQSKRQLRSGIKRNKSQSAGRAAEKQAETSQCSKHSKYTGRPKKYDGPQMGAEMTKEMDKATNTYNNVQKGVTLLRHHCKELVQHVSKLKPRVVSMADAIECADFFLQREGSVAMVKRDENKKLTISFDTSSRDISFDKSRRDKSFDKSRRIIFVPYMILQMTHVVHYFNAIEEAEKREDPNPSIARGLQMACQEQGSQEARTFLRKIATDWQLLLKERDRLIELCLDALELFKKEPEDLSSTEELATAGSPKKKSQQDRGKNN